MPWTDAYMDIPFAANGRDRKGCDCWGLVRLVYYEQLDIDLPAYDQALANQSIPALAAARKILRTESSRWQPVKKQKAFDLVLFRGVPGHVGVVVDLGDMLHVCTGMHSIVEPYAGLAWGLKQIGFFRYAG